MGQLLRLIIVEDTPDDVVLILREIRKSGFKTEHLVVEMADDLAQALDQAPWDIIVADYVLPRFSGLEVIKIVKNRDAELPVIITSGKIDEETIVETLKTGANNYISKGNLGRLGPAIKREVQDLKERQEKRRVEQELAQSNLQIKLILESVGEGICSLDKKGRITLINPAGLAMTGYSSHELIGQPVDRLFGNFTRIYRTPESFANLTGSNFFAVSNEVFWRKDGTNFPVEYVSTPILANGEMIGAVIVFRDVTERKKAQEALEQSYADLQATLEATVQALAALGEVRDPYTAGHQQRVSILAAAIARKMSLDPQRVEAVRVAGILHDIGKICVPTDILNKPGRLNKFEMAIIKQHVLVGSEILKQIPFAYPVSQFVLQHHERLDGSGYPQGLSGAEILVEAKIIAVADVVEAMASHRPYRPAIGIELALAEIKEKRNLYFDSAVVDACLSLFTTQEFEFN